MQRTAVVERCVLEDQATEVTVRCHDVVGLFLLTELVTSVLGLFLRGLANQRRSYQRTVHGGEQRPTEYTGYTQHVEGVHQNVVLGLEHQHEVEGAGNTQRHAVRERTLTDGVNQEHCGSGCNRRRVSDCNPGAHA